MIRKILLLLFLANILFLHSSRGCSCRPISIKYEADSAYDILIGKIISEREEAVQCEYQRKNQKYDWYTSYIYKLDVNFSYKEKMKDQVEIFGGKGYGDCGAIFEAGESYLIVIHKCNKGYFTYL